MRFTFSNVTTLPRDQFITLKYTLPLAAILDYMGNQPSGVDRWIQRLMFDLKLENTATTNAKDSKNNQLTPDTDKSTTPLKKTFLTKDGKGEINGATNEITWTATVGNGTMTLNGKIITDALGTTPAHTISGNVTVKFYGADLTTQIGTMQTIIGVNGTTRFTYLVIAFKKAL